MNLRARHKNKKSNTYNYENEAKKLKQWCRSQPNELCPGCSNKKICNICHDINGDAIFFASIKQIIKALKSIEPKSIKVEESKPINNNIMTNDLKINNYFLYDNTLYVCIVNDKNNKWITAFDINECQVSCFDYDNTIQKVYVDKKNSIVKYTLQPKG